MVMMGGFSRALLLVQLTKTPSVNFGIYRVAFYLTGSHVMSYYYNNKIRSVFFLVKKISVLVKVINFVLTIISF